MDTLLYWLVRSLVALLQALPLTCVARLGRACGALAYWLDARHRKVALQNLTACFAKEKPPVEIIALAKENFRRLGENYACAIKTASMSWEELKPHVEFSGGENVRTNRSVLMTIGHFGNFEIYTAFTKFMPGFQAATTYRALPQPSLNRIMQSLREKSGCLYFERRTDFAKLKTALTEKRLMLGILADQHAGRNGLRLPFFGRDCSTSAAPAVLAHRYQMTLHTGICRRIGLARWRLEAGAEIPTSESGQPRTPKAIMLDVNRALEVAVRRDPANWFWVHNRWKTPGRKSEAGSQKPESSAEMEAVP